MNDGVASCSGFVIGFVVALLTVACCWPLSVCGRQMCDWLIFGLEILH